MLKHECAICGEEADYKERDEDRYRYYCIRCVEENITESLEKIEDDD